MRNLVTIQTIKSLDPIPEKDRIVLAKFENVDWQVIVDKSYTVGETVVYCEYDTVLPPMPQFEFLRNRCWNSKWNGFRITNMKMAGVYSQGIVFHISEVLINSAHPSYAYKDGNDVTELIGAVKYDPESLVEQSQTQQKEYGPIMRRLLKIKFIRNLLYSKKKSNSWPTWISKTDETRVQVLSYVYDNMKGVQVYVTEKVDGQSATYAVRKKRFYVCSRNLVQPTPKMIHGKYQTSSNFWFTATKYQIEKKLKIASKKWKSDLYIQGEQIGPGIQGNKYKLTDIQFRLFNVYSLKDKRYFDFDELFAFSRETEIPMVPFIEVKIFDWQNVDELLEYSKGVSILDSPVHPLREGIVIRSCISKPPMDKMSNMTSFKVINPDFDLKYSKSSE